MSAYTVTLDTLDAGTVHAVDLVACSPACVELILDEHGLPVDPLNAPRGAVSSTRTRPSQPSTVAHWYPSTKAGECNGCAGDATPARRSPLFAGLSFDGPGDLDEDETTSDADPAE